MFAENDAFCATVKVFCNDVAPITFNVLPNTFVTSQNPTFDSNRNKVAFTEVGIYDASDNLVAIGKFSQPITRKYNSDIISLQATIDF